jgi:signal transduction histidine kinase/CheY-like chemotaxis protein
MTENPSQRVFLAGRGEMVERTRAFPWHHTPLGAPEAWSKSLRCTVGLLLNSRHPMLLWWGRELVQLYNDAYRSSLGEDRHPRALGARGPDFWASSWSEFGPRIEAAMDWGEVARDEDRRVCLFRNGRLEEAYWTYSYSPVLDDEGRIGGTLLSVHDETACFIGRRRLRTLRRIAARAAPRRDEAAAWAAALEVLADNSYDVPWVVGYAVATSERGVKLVGRHLAGHSLNGAELTKDAGIDAQPWPIREVLERGEPRLVEDVQRRVGDVRGGPWPEPVRSAWVLPVRRAPGSAPRGVLVLGVSPRLPFDGGYRDFLALAADHLATAITAAPEAGAEQERADALPRIEAVPGVPEPHGIQASRWVSESDDGGAAAGGLVLLVGGQVEMRDELEGVLSPHWSVVAIGAGARALEAARSELPDVVLIDAVASMPDAVELLRSLRADERTKEIGVIMLCAGASERSRLEGLAVRADDHIARPFSAEKLLAHVRRHAEAGRFRRVTELERARLYALFDQVPAAIAVLRGPSHMVEFVNSRYSEACGRPVCELLGKPIDVAHPELSGSSLLDLLSTVYRGGETLHIPDLEGVWGHRRDGARSRASFDWTCWPLTDESGRTVGTVQFFFDVTEIVAVRRELESARKAAEVARAEAESANRAKDEFLAMLGHELRNPLAPILTALQLMRLRNVDAAANERGIIERQVKHLLGLVDDLLDVSRITRGKVKLRMERVELAEVVAKAVEIASPLLEQQQHHLRIDVPNSGLLVRADPDRLAQVIANLLTNAAKYTQEGGTVTVAGGRERTDVVVKVRDTGIGIEPEMLTKVFDLFMQERQALDRAGGGLGLGLAIVRSLVDLHGGRVTAASDGRGTGSEFIVRLPALLGNRAPTPARGTAVATAPSPPSGYRILIVDDNEDAAEMLALSLAALGHTTRVAHDGPAALRLALDFEPHVALLDIGLPVMDGYDLAKRFRDDDVLGRVRLVALTGYGRRSDRRQSREAGFEGHLVKPVDVHELNTIICQEGRPSSAGDESGERQG